MISRKSEDYNEPNLEGGVGLCCGLSLTHDKGPKCCVIQIVDVRCYPRVSQTDS